MAAYAPLIIVNPILRPGGPVSALNLEVACKQLQGSFHVILCDHFAFPHLCKGSYKESGGFLPHKPLEITVFYELIIKKIEKILSKIKDFNESQGFIRAENARVACMSSCKNGAINALLAPTH